MDEKRTGISYRAMSIVLAGMLALLAALLTLLACLLFWPARVEEVVVPVPGPTETLLVPIAPTMTPDLPTVTGE